MRKANGLFTEKRFRLVIPLFKFFFINIKAENLIIYQTYMKWEMKAVNQSMLRKKFGYFS